MKKQARINKERIFDENEQFFLFLFQLNLIKIESNRSSENWFFLFRISLVFFEENFPFLSRIECDSSSTIIII